MLWNEFVKLNHISKLPLNEQVRKFNEYTLDEENLHHSTKNVGASLASIIITNEDIGLTTRLFINGVLDQTQTGAGSSKSTLLNPGSTFFIILDNIQEYDAIEYYLTNKGVQISYNNSIISGSPVISPTFTATASSNYVFRCNGYST